MVKRFSLSAIVGLFVTLGLFYLMQALIQGADSALSEDKIGNLVDFGGGNNNLLIHHDRGLEYLRDGFLEEVFLHEAAHTSLDSYHSTSKGWINAQLADNGNFISDYAKKYPKKEDIAETFPLCFALEFKKDRLEDEVIQKIEKAIPNRIKYCLNVFENTN